MPSLEDAIALALEVHREQRDKGGMPYILHPLRVMLRMDTMEEMMTAVLHDVLEDAGERRSTLHGQQFPPAVREALAVLTRKAGESYEAYIDRVRANPLASKVKQADIHDNINILRLPELAGKDWERLRRYHRAWRRLTGRAERSTPGEE